MKKSSLLCIMFILGIVLTSCQKQSADTQDSTLNMEEQDLEPSGDLDIARLPESEEISENIPENTENKRQDLYDSLNTTEMYECLYVKPSADIHERALELDQSDVYVKAEYDCAYVPQELILAAEEFLCKISKGGDGSYFYEGDEFAALGSYFGSDELILSLEEVYELFPGVCEHREEIEDIYDAYELLAQEVGMSDCSGAYRYVQDGHEYYVFICPTGGSAGFCIVRLAERIDGEVVTITEFDTQNTGYGRVVECQGSYYYMFMQYNYNLKYYDEVRIYHLGAETETENVRVRYIPEHYDWTTVYENEKSGTESVWEYVYQVQEELLSGDYLETGRINSELKIHIGDEKEAVDFPKELIGVEGVSVYQIDMTNTGIPVYVEKRLFYPSNGLTLEMLMYYFAEATGEEDFQELEALSTYGRGGVCQNELVQMWFRERDGLVYTFQVYHIDNYSYLLNVMLIQGDQITMIGQSIATPTRGFEFTEGEAYRFG